MGDISPNFNRREFACKCGACDYDMVDVELIEVLERIRRVFGARVIITSGCRCPVHNVNEDGSIKSRHVRGQAADFIVAGVYEGQIADWLEDAYPDRYGIGRYDGRTHVDVRSKPARWGIRRTGVSGEQGYQEDQG